VLAYIRYHVKLLKKRIHVTGATKIFKANISGSLLDPYVSVELVHVDTSPRFFNLPMKLVEYLQSRDKVFFILLAQREQQEKCSFSCLSIQLLLLKRPKLRLFDRIIALDYARICINNELCYCGDQIALLSNFAFHLWNYFQN
jgi:hypothetical protein